MIFLKQVKLSYGCNLRITAPRQLHWPQKEISSSFL
ncbi:uncharacterized protein CELE_Y54G2A.72 [Caenorhabditis elegans]|uniref:Uncharacterized protein n=1 Tax=Caenorhabditis elegans TaxID=6239 RepID=I2HA86_CAEEL|nr:Uncharacterized protein CELE_Y54G2A.72 [Caenorhabditis elegans]CCH63793.1 Uncharacterized protein CELE_Y54G2A.72 [Caenorhabditis elegans]|eukprot:NP_001255241.1 Uncharacterized protein CELE_Y54G2A.72 [Caenorhabditis elegans]